MRMWKIDTEFLCRQHLLGEHNELHKFAGALNKEKNIKGFIEKGLMEVHNIVKRHNELVKEMNFRGYKHNSLLPKFKIFKAGKINVSKNKKDLFKRCDECRRRAKCLKDKN